MKPILRQIRTKLIKNLQQSELKSAMTIAASDAFSSNEYLALQAAQAQPFVLLVSLPFPVQTLELPIACWATLSLHCALIQSLHHASKEDFIDWVEIASFCITEKDVCIEKICTCHFGFVKKEPLKWLEIPNAYAVQMNFITTNLDIHRS